MARKVKCYGVMYKGHFHRPFGKVLSIHATSFRHAMRLLKTATHKRFRHFHGLYVRENARCELSGQCNFYIIAKPPYDNTPFGHEKPADMPPWEMEINTISQERQAVIDRMRASQPSLYDG